MRIFTLHFLISFLLLSCIDREKPVNKAKLKGDDYRLFQNTPAWELAKAVQDENEDRIKGILVKDPGLVNFQEPKFGHTLLQLTIRNQQLESFKLLLANKANIHIHDTYDGTSALIEACRYPWYDIRFAEILVQNGANVNDVEVGERRKGNSTRFTPLMEAAKEGRLDMVKLFVSNGANIDYQNEYKQSALSQAVILEHYDVLLFLLQNGVDYKLPITYNETQHKTYYLVDELRFFMPDLGSKDHQLKKQVVDYLKTRGVDCNAVPISEFVKKKAQRLHPNNWQQYLEKY
ncbi:MULTISPECIES: ankyrin repeat domain-containing protein [Niastella]|uniref:Ankyrin repeat domain-containing protein n=1 Tax=Niastella soli TaxID=2821487 RepID=A0ABS3YX30_9BACT|nr:ankyrin repeat domain-containing protein [Niastella soli]MBO9202428.1 ankyrin repeat domain-containing protein [Niastella soli]